jgi:hypothetical protein
VLVGHRDVVAVRKSLGQRAPERRLGALVLAVFVLAHRVQERALGRLLVEPGDAHRGLRWGRRWRGRARREQGRGAACQQDSGSRHAARLLETP